jgi:hypothetical protein
VGTEPASYLAEPVDLSRGRPVPALETSAAPLTDAAASDPAAEALASRWYDQLLGFDALEAYAATSGTERLGFSIARKWYDGRIRMVMKVEEPRAIDELAFLLYQNPDRADDYFVYLTPQLFDAGAVEMATGPGGKVRRLQMPGLDYEVPMTGGGFPIGELRGFLPGELSWRRLPDEVVFQERCAVIEGRPARHGFRFDRLQLALSERTGVSLRSLYFQKGEVVRTVLARPRDVGERQGRFLPIRRQIMGKGTREFELVLRNLVIDPALPDRLFTTHRLRYQRFPRF